MYIRYAFILITGIYIHTTCASESKTLRQTQACTIPLRKKLEKTQSLVSSTSPMQLNVSFLDEKTTPLSAAYAFAQFMFQEDIVQKESSH